MLAVARLVAKRQRGEAMIPEELKSLNQWLCWNEVEGRKVPVIAATGHSASSTDPATWCDYDMADACKSSYTGLGFVFRPGGGIVGMDLDCCLNEAGELAAWAAPVLAMFPTYAEVSPSGRGIKLWIRGDISSATKCKWYPCGKPVVGVKHGPAVEMYAAKRFFTVTGDRWRESPLEIVDCQSSLDFLISAHFTSPVYVRRNAYERNGTDAAFKRAEAYVSKIPGAVSGQHGHDATFNVACHLVRGFRLGYDDAMAIISDWNSTCLPPWEEHDIERKISEAISKSTRSDGYLLDRDERPLTDCSVVDLNGLMPLRVNAESHDEPVEDPIIDAVPVISPDLLQPGGLLQEIINFNLRTAIKPQPELALAGAIALLATIIGRKVEDDYGTRPNIYLVGIGASGSGKDNSRRVNKALLAAAGAEHMLQDDLASSAGLHSAMTASPSTLLQLDEFGRLLATLGNPAKSPWLYQIVSVLLKLYSSSCSLYLGPSYANTTKNARIPFPNCVLYGTTVPASFFGALTREALSDGLFNRLLIVEASNSDPDLQTPEAMDAPFLLVEEIRRWLGFNPGCASLIQTLNPTARRLVTSPEAKEEFNRLDVTVRQRQREEDKRGTQVWGRCAENARKLALIHQCSLDRESTAISIESARWGCRLALHLTNRVEQLAEAHVADGEFDALGKKFLRFVREGAGRERTKTEVCRHLRGQKNREMEEIIGKLVSTEELMVDSRESPSGRATTVYRAL